MPRPFGEVAPHHHLRGNAQATALLEEGFSSAGRLAGSVLTKLEVLAVDSTARRVDFKILVDENCDYRGLAPGIPQQ